MTKTYAQELIEKNERLIKQLDDAHENFWKNINEHSAPAFEQSIAKINEALRKAQK